MKKHAVSDTKTWQTFFQRITSGQPLTTDESAALFEAMLEHQIPGALSGAILGALATRGEHPDEIAGAAGVLAGQAITIELPEDLQHSAIDTCGTGGDHAGTFNISTTVAILAAACGVPVAKHGNRAASSRSGSADMLEALGVNLAIDEATSLACLQQAGITFLFAPTHHSVLANIAPLRKTLGGRTIFNVLGPLLNPMGVKRQLLGVFAEDRVLPMAKTLQQRGSTKALVVHGAATTGRLDELALDGINHLALYTEEVMTIQALKASSVGLQPSSLESLKGDTPEENAAITRGILDNQEHGPKRDVVLLNTAAALIVGDAVDTSKDIGHQFKEGIEIAAKAIDSGKAIHTLGTLIRVSNGR